MKPFVMRRGIIICLLVIFYIIIGYTFNNDRKLNIAKENEENIAIIPPRSGIVNLEIKNGKGNARIHKKADQIIYITFESFGYKEILAQIIPQEPDANICLSQIQFPDNRRCGPFAKTMNYKLPIDGKYKLHIHEDLLAGGTWSGDFIVDITLNK